MGVGGPGAARGAWVWQETSAGPGGREHGSDEMSRVQYPENTLAESCSLLSGNSSPFMFLFSSIPGSARQKLSKNYIVSEQSQKAPKSSRVSIS